MKNASVFAATVLGIASMASAVNLLTDPSFEAPITFDGPPFVGSWEGFNGAGASASNSTISPRTGAGHIDLTIGVTAPAPNTFAGLFQDVVVSPGASMTFEGYHKTPSQALGVASELRIEWRNSVSNTEISRTPNVMTVPGSLYSLITVNAIVPAGVDTGRFVYAIQTFGGEPNPGDSGTVYLDDFSVTVVPEPTTLALIVPCAIGLLRRARR